MRESDLLEMRADGYGATARLDFDLGLRGFMRWAEHRQQETTLEAAPPDDGKPKRAVPKYKTLAEVLGLPSDAEQTLAEHGVTTERLERFGADLLAYLGSAPPGDEQWRDSLDRHSAEPA